MFSKCSNKLCPWICTTWFAMLWERWSHDLVLTGQVSVNTLKELIALHLRNSKDHFNNTDIVNFDIIRKQVNGDPPGNKTSWWRHKTYLYTAKQQQDIVKLLIIIINEYIFIYIKSIVLRSFFVVSVNSSKSNGLLAFRTWSGLHSSAYLTGSFPKALVRS